MKFFVVLIDKIAQENCEDFTILLIIPFYPNILYENDFWSLLFSFYYFPVHGLLFRPGHCALKIIYISLLDSLPLFSKSKETPDSEPVEMYFKKDGQFIKIGAVDKASLANFAVARTRSSTTRMQQTTATTVTTFHEPSLNDTLTGNLSGRQGTPVPGHEDSPYQLSTWDQSPVADKSPIITRMMARLDLFSRRFLFKFSTIHYTRMRLIDWFASSSRSIDWLINWLTG